MSYQKTVWVDDSTPAINAANLNNIENGIEELFTRSDGGLANITVLQTEMDAAEASIATNAANHTALVADINSAVIRRTGTFSGSWNPTLLSTFGITNHTDYWWTIQVNQPTLTLQNGHTIICDGYLDIDENTLRFTSTDNGVGVSADYLLVGISKDMGNYAVVNQS